MAALVRLCVLVVPIAAGVASGVLLARTIPRASGILGIAWIGLVLLGSLLAVNVVERLGRRLLPLATLLNLSLAFPDRAPSRFKLARRAGNIRILEDRARDAREHGLDDDPARAAETVLTLVAALSAHDRKTRGHAERVRAFTDMLAAEYGLAPGDRDRLRWAALLHDIGKLEVPSDTLNKPGKPDEAEWEILRRHPLEGERIAAPLLPWLGGFAAVIGQHHERWDGAGYPRGVAGEELALGARIVGVADSFEVMTAARSYKRPMTPNAARRELQRCAGTQFDPQVVRAFLGISVGRLWLTVGPASWVAQVPFMLGIGRAGGQAVTLARAAGVVAINGLAGALALGVGVAAAVPAPRAETPSAIATASPGAASPSLVTPSVSIQIVPSHADDESAMEEESPDDAPEGAADPGVSTSTDAGTNAPAQSGAGSDSGEAAIGGTVDAVEGVVQGTAQTVGAVVEETTATVQEVVQTAADTAGTIVQTADDAVEDVVDTVTESVDTVETTVDDTVDEVGDTLDDVLGGLG
jgi:hypothetical protein